MVIWEQCDQIGQNFTAWAIFSGLGQKHSKRVKKLGTFLDEFKKSHIMKFLCSEDKKNLEKELFYGKHLDQKGTIIFPNIVFLKQNFVSCNI